MRASPRSAAVSIMRRVTICTPCRASHDDSGSFHRGKNRQRPSEKVGVPGRIDEVHVPGNRNRSSRPRCGASAGAPSPAGRSRIRTCPSSRFRAHRECRHARAMPPPGSSCRAPPCPDQGHVADVVGGVLGHRGHPPYSGARVIVRDAPVYGRSRRAQPARTNRRRTRPAMSPRDGAGSAVSAGSSPRDSSGRDSMLRGFRAP